MEQVECIVVGGGLAGLSAAYGLASAGVEVMVLERGDYCGAKNVTGGRLYLEPVRRFYPELWDEAPLERPVTRERLTVAGDGAHLTLEVGAERFDGARPHSATVVRARLDQWLAEKVAEKGGVVVPGMKVDALLREGGRVTGIRAGGDEIGAGVVIVAEGVLRLLSAEAGLAAAPQAHDHAVGFKEVLELPAGTIEERFGLEPGEGAAHLFMGAVTRGLPGGGFLYTNRDSVALGVVVGMAALRGRADGLESWQLLEEVRQQPFLRPLLEGATLAEYSAHAIAEGGISQVPALYGDGYLLAGDTAGLSLNALVTVRGMDFALASGYFAAEAVKRARPAGRYAAADLACYETMLRGSFVLRDLETMRDAPRALENGRLFRHYPDAVTRLAAEVYTVGEGPSPGLVRTLWQGLRRDFVGLDTLRDLWSLRHI